MQTGKTTNSPNILLKARRVGKVIILDIFSRALALKNYVFQIWKMLRDEDGFE